MARPILEIEQAVLGAMLLKPDVIPDVIQVLQKEHFSIETHRRIYAAIIAVYDQGYPVDILTVRTELNQDGKTDIDAMAMIDLTESVISPANAEYHAQQVHDAYGLRTLKQICQSTAQETDSADFTELVEQHEGKIFQLAQKRIYGKIYTMEESVDAAYRAITDPKKAGLLTGFYELDALTGGLKPGDYVIVAGRPSMGKAQPLTSNVLLADGSWRLMKDIAIGDQLASIDGKSSCVSNIFPQGTRPIYVITLSDGRQIEADAEHLWTIKSYRWQKCRQVTTLELMTMTQKMHYRSRIRLAQHNGNFGITDDIGIDPWLLGFLLGDGCLTKSGVVFSNPEPYILNKIRAITDMELKSHNGKDWRILHGGGTSHPIRESLKSLGVMDLHSHEKYIPEIVFTAVRPIRVSLLAGLLESDGWVEKFGSVRYSTSSEMLADGLVRLVRSLSGYASKRIKQFPEYSYNGERRIGRPAYLVTVALDGLNNIIQSPRLTINLKRQRPASPVVMSIEYVRDDLAQCIKVTHPSNLYITDGYTVTHNTAFCLSIMQNMAKEGKGSGLFTLETTKEQILNRLMAAQAKINSIKIRTGRLSEHEIAHLSNVCAELSNWPIYIDDSGDVSITQIRAKARRMVTRYNPAIIVVDYLQLIRSSTRYESRHHEVEEISGRLRSLAKELDLPIIAVSQLSRKTESRENRRPGLADLRESGAIEQDATLALFIYRPEAYRMKEFEDGTPSFNLAEIIVGKHKDGPTGDFRLTFLKEFTRFENLEGTYSAETNG